MIWEACVEQVTPTMVGGTTRVQFMMWDGLGNAMVPDGPETYSTTYTLALLICMLIFKLRCVAAMATLQSAYEAPDFSNWWVRTRAWLEKQFYTMKSLI